MELIKVKNITKSHRAISAVDGATIFNLVQEAFRNNEKVTLDFEGIDLTITAFLNSSIGNLYSDYHSDQIKKLLDIKNMPPDELELLKLVIERAKLRFSKDYPSGLDEIDIVDEG